MPPKRAAGDPRDQVGRLGLLPEAGGNELRFGADRLQLGEHACAFGRVTPGDGNPRALGGSTQRDRPANA